MKKIGLILILTIAYLTISTIPVLASEGIVVPPPGYCVWINHPDFTGTFKVFEVDKTVDPPEVYGWFLFRPGQGELATDHMTVETTYSPATDQSFSIVYPLGWIVPKEKYGIDTTRLKLDFHGSKYYGWGWDTGYCIPDKDWVWEVFDNSFE